MPADEGPSTRSVHLGKRVQHAGRTIVPPLVENVAFAFEDLEAWRAVALHEAPGDIYSRNSNPTTRLFEQQVAALAQTAIEFPPMQAPASFNLEAVKRHIQQIMKSHEGQ